ncbi:caspase-3-like [Littorina saxatilis]|uniref:Uncharacterized protein n=1 Tax=Littorina saxatilis TaxID=31220 RepID=A0AAN9BXP5_9CAEN
MDDDCSNPPTASDEKDFPMSMSSVRDAMKTVMKPFASRQANQEPVVWDDSDDYSTGNGPRGIALVVINETFRGHKGRTGSELDAQNLCRTFSLLGFEVRLVKDCTLNEFKQMLEQVAKEDHSSAGCFVLAISSHGDELLQDRKSALLNRKVREDVVFCTDFYMSTRELVLYFSDTNCPTLKGKPRLFFLQACRGGSLDEGQEVKVIMSPQSQAGQDEVDAPELPEVVVSPAPCFKDFLIMCATPPGYYAFRRPTDGSWFVQALCSVLENCDGSRDVLQMLTRVINIVAQEYESCVPLNPDNDKKKQTPCIYSMLTKDVYWKVTQQPGKILSWQ